MGLVVKITYGADFDRDGADGEPGDADAKIDRIRSGTRDS